MPFFDRLMAETAADRDRMLATPILQRALAGSVTADEYQAFLGQAYHHVRHTVPLLMACGAGLSERHVWLREAVARYIAEELGHEAWILDDIQAAGGDADQARTAPPATATELMVSYAYHTIDRVNPVGFFGMVLVLEGTSVGLAHRAAGAIKESLGLPDDAFRYLTSHGSVDQDHIRFLEDLMNWIDDEDDQAAVIHAARMFYRLYGDVFHSLDS